METELKEITSNKTMVYNEIIGMNVFAPKDTARSSLEYIKVENGKAIATNGHLMIIGYLKHKDIKMKQGFIGRETAKTTKQDKNFATAIEYETESVNYPNVKPIIDKIFNLKPVDSVKCFNTEYMSIISSYVKKYSTDRIKSFTIESLEDNYNLIRFENNNFKFIVILMSIRK